MKPSRGALTNLASVRPLFRFLLTHPCSGNRILNEGKVSWDPERSLSPCGRSYRPRRNAVAEEFPRQLISDTHLSAPRSSRSVSTSSTEYQANAGNGCNDVSEALRTKQLVALQLQMTNGKSHAFHVALRKSELAAETGLGLRDLRAVDPSFLNQIPTILARPRAIVLSLAHVKAIIMADRVFVFNLDSQRVKHRLVPNLTRRLRATVCRERGAESAGPQATEGQRDAGPRRDATEERCHPVFHEPKQPQHEGKPVQEWLSTTEPLRRQEGTGASMEGQARLKDEGNREGHRRGDGYARGAPTLAASIVAEQMSGAKRAVRLGPEGRRAEGREGQEREEGVGYGVGHTGLESGCLDMLEKEQGGVGLQQGAVVGCEEGEEDVGHVQAYQGHTKGEKADVLLLNGPPGKDVFSGAFEFERRQQSLSLPCAEALEGDGGTASLTLPPCQPGREGDGGRTHNKTAHGVALGVNATVGTDDTSRSPQQSGRCEDCSEQSWSGNGVASGQEASGRGRFDEPPGAAGQTRIEGQGASGGADMGAEARTGWAAGGGGSGAAEPTAGAGGLPFEMQVLECLLDEVDTTIRAKFSTVAPEVIQVVKQCVGDSRAYELTSEGQQQFLQAKNRLLRLEKGVEQVAEALKELLSNDDDMAAMYLTRKLTTGPSSEHSQLEELVEDYLKRVEEVGGEVETLNLTVDATAQYMRTALDSVRNQLIRLDLLVNMATCSLAVGGTVAAVFGMNLTSELEQVPAAFLVVSGAVATTSAIVFSFFVLYARRRRIL